jgi:hypothetical protein
MFNDEEDVKVVVYCFLKYFLFRNILKLFFYFLKFIFDIIHQNDLKHQKILILKKLK